MNLSQIKTQENARIQLLTNYEKEKKWNLFKEEVNKTYNLDKMKKNKCCNLNCDKKALYN